RVGGDRVVAAGAREGGAAAAGCHLGAGGVAGVRVVPAGDVGGPFVRAVVELVRVLHVAEDVVLEKDLGLLAGPDAVVRVRRRIQVGEDVVLAEPDARLALDHAVGPPVVVPGDVQRLRVVVAAGAVGAADQVAVAMAAGAGRVVSLVVGA